MALPPIPDHLVEVLRRPNPAVVATLRPDGAPVTVATWYLWEDGQILLNMDSGRRRLGYLRNDPRVSLTVFDGDQWHRYIGIQGKVTIQPDADLSIIDRVARHYDVVPYPDRDRPRTSAWLNITSYHVWGFKRHR